METKTIKLAAVFLFMAVAVIGGSSMVTVGDCATTDDQVYEWDEVYQGTQEGVESLHITMSPISESEGDRGIMRIDKVDKEGGVISSKDVEFSNYHNILNDIDLQDNPTTPAPAPVYPQSATVCEAVSEVFSEVCFAGC